MSLEENDPFTLPPDDAPSVPATPTLPPRSAAPAPSRGGAPMSLEENDPFALPPDDAPSVPATPAPPPRGAAPAPAPAFEEMEGLEGNNPFATFDPVAALAPAAKSPAPSPAPAASGIPDWGAPQGAVPAGIPDWGAPSQGSAPTGIPDWGAPQGAVPAGIPDWGAPQTAAATPIAKANAPTPGPGRVPPRACRGWRPWRRA